MVTIRPADVNTVRAAMTWATRAAAVPLGAAGAYLALKKILFGLGTAQPNMILDVYEGIGESHSFYCGISMIAVSLALGLSSTRLARWIVALPPDTCPRCGYAIDRANPVSRCPECGLPDLAATTPTP